ncbi:MAG: hypothetical protein J7L46_01355 [Bacteroidales bacterium]|nr:hypothetical protein [Bacteroidales bacterium]
MIKYLFFFFFGIVLLGSSQTYLVIDTTFSVSIDTDNEVIYLDNYSTTTYKETFIEQLLLAFSDKDIQMVFSENNNTNTFYLNIAKCRLTENIRRETVEDTASEQYGQSYDLSTCEMKVEYVLSTHNHQTVGSWKTLSLRQETLSNSRSFFDWLFGVNKNNTEYHEKTLENDIFLQEIQTITERLARKIAKKIKKSRKKNP